MVPSEVLVVLISESNENYYGHMNRSNHNANCYDNSGHSQNAMPIKIMKIVAIVMLET